MENDTAGKSRGFNLPLVILSVAGAFLVGMFYNRMQGLEKQVAEFSAMQNSGQQAQVGNIGTVGGTQPAAAAQPPTTQSAGEVDPVTEEDHVRGDRSARIMLIEYSDLECPFCKQFHPTAQRIVEAYNGDVAWVYRHFPLTQLHSKAPKEAEAVECANELGGNDGFWKLTDKIFEVSPANNGLDLAILPDLAAQTGLDKNKFKTCLDSGKYAQHVQDDFVSGQKAGVTGTPGNVLLDTQTGKTTLLPGAYPFDQVKAAIDAMLQG
jgi:protein-disulfide isomerase